MSGGGFVMVPEWLRRKKPSGNALLAYVCLGSFGTFNPGSGTYDECRPSLKRLADEMGVSLATAKRALHELVEDLGAAERSTRNGVGKSKAPSVYRLHFGVVKEPERNTGSPVSHGRLADEPTPRLADEPRVGSQVSQNLEPSTKNPSTKISSRKAASNASSAPSSSSVDDEEERVSEAKKQVPKQRKPRRTPEQRKADEREAAIQFVLDEINPQISPDLTPKGAALLVDHLIETFSPGSIAAYVASIPVGELCDQFETGYIEKYGDVLDRMPEPK